MATTTTSITRPNGECGVGECGVGGVGLLISEVVDKRTRVAELRVIDVLPDSEAARNSVCVGDTLVAVDKKSCQQRSKEEMLGLISGQVGSVVRLDLRRNAGRHAGVVYWVQLRRQKLLGIEMRSSQCTVKELQDLTDEEKAVFVVVHACTLQ